MLFWHCQVKNNYRRIGKLLWISLSHIMCGIPKTEEMSNPLIIEKIKLIFYLLLINALNGSGVGSPFWFRLEGRLNEMQERRRRLIKYLYKKESKLHEFEEGFKQSINKKSTIIKKFTCVQLEDLLRTSTKNVAQEVVSSLIPQQGGLGVLADIDRVYGVVTSNEAKRKLATQNQRKREDIDDGYENTGAASGDNTDMSNRGAATNAVRQSKSANGARSLTRKNQQQFTREDDSVFPVHSQAKQQNLMQQQTQNSSATRVIAQKANMMPSNRMVFTQGAVQGNGIGVDSSQQNLTDIIQKREISSTYIKRILDNQAVLK